MTLKTAIVQIGKKYRVYTEHYLNATADKTIILVNGSLATTASFAQTVRYLRPRFNVVLYDQPYACLLYTSPSPRDGLLSRMPSSA